MRAFFYNKSMKAKIPLWHIEDAVWEWHSKLQTSKFKDFMKTGVTAALEEWLLDHAPSVPYEVKVKYKTFPFEGEEEAGFEDNLKKLHKDFELHEGDGIELTIDIQRGGKITVRYVEWFRWGNEEE